MSLEVVQASITSQHNTLHVFCLYRPPPYRQNNLTNYVYQKKLHDLDDVSNLSSHVCLVGDMSIYTDFEFSDTVLKWLLSYLTDRPQHFSLSNNCSAFAPVHSGVP